MVPVAYEPNNDLYISADQGGFEIINVHPGSDLYTELRLRVNWSGSGKSLLKIVVAPGPRVINVPGVVSWPSDGTAVHEDVTSDVKVIFGETDVDAKIELTDRFGVSSEFVATDGTITIPGNSLSDTVNRRLSLKLIVNSIDVSEVLFLPETETEDFSLDGLIKNDGTTEATNDYSLTDYIDIYDVVEIVYTGNTGGAANPLAAYDENREFVKMLLSKGANTNRHVAVDGTYRYIRACAVNTVSKSLKLYFRTRG